MFVSTDVHLLPETIGAENFRRYLLRDDGLVLGGAVDARKITGPSPIV
jgi:hypothetical protein